MQPLHIPEGLPSDEALSSLAEECKAARKAMLARESEVKLPLFIEFAGSPKSGKSAIIGIVGHFFKRMGFDVLQPAEGASLRTPQGLRDDWLAFNTWSGCYALQQILVDCSTNPPPHLVLLDRGLFDVAGWMEYLRKAEGRLSEEDRDCIVGFFARDLWRCRQNMVFLFTADHATSLRRETEDKLTLEAGSVMNADILDKLKDAYKSVANRLSDQFDLVYHVDTSFQDQSGRRPSFQQIAYVIAERIVKLIQELSAQVLLVTTPVDFKGFESSDEQIEKTVASILNSNKPRFLARESAEKTLDVQQVVPYAVLVNTEGKYFCAKRRSDVDRKELQGKHTLLVGGHAEQRDWDEAKPNQVFENCLRREIDEELIGAQVRKVRPVGFIHDVRSRMGSQHLAFIHEITVGGRTVIRRQALDQEFGRETVSWKTKEEIKTLVKELDPWSQFVAAALFDASIPSSDGDPTLFAGDQGLVHASGKKRRFPKPKGKRG
ncbi:MAG: NUDIX domain-containing protein [Phycisphaerae bacterium]